MNRISFLLAATALCVGAGLPAQAREYKGLTPPPAFLQIGKTQEGGKTGAPRLPLNVIAVMGDGDILVVRGIETNPPTWNLVVDGKEYTVVTVGMGWHGSWPAATLYWQVP